MKNINSITFKVQRALKGVAKSLLMGFVFLLGMISFILMSLPTFVCGLFCISFDLLKYIGNNTTKTYSSFESFYDVLMGNRPRRNSFTAYARFINFLSKSGFVDQNNFMNLRMVALINKVEKSFSKVGMEVKNPHIIVLMAMPTVTQVIIATMKEPTRWGDRGAFALARFNACTANPLIVILAATMIIFQADLVLFNTAQANMATGAHTAKEIRDKAWQLVKNHLLVCMAVAQANSNATPLMGIEIIQSGLFGIKSVPAHELDVFSATNASPGEMYLKAPGAERDAVHDFEISLDGITWRPYMSVHERYMTATGLTPVTKVWFRTRARVKGLAIPPWTVIYVTVI